MICVLCERPDETEETGTLSSKENVVAHQNCLLFASGLFCENSPEYDDLFGFSVNDLLEEVKRGKRLMCFKCNKKGATAGCEVRRCRKSYHYPCAVEDGAQTIEETAQGTFTLYCAQHYPMAAGNGASTNGSSSSPLTPSACQAGTSKKRTVTSANPAEPSAKRPFVNSEKHEAAPRIQQEDSDSDLSIFAPLESDILEDEDSLQPETSAAADLTGPAGSRRRTASTDDSLPEPDWERLHATMGTEVRTQTVMVEVYEPSPAHSLVAPTAAVPPPPPEHTEAPGVSASPPPVASISSPATRELSIDSASFWKSCNEAGCTKAIFSGFLQEMNDMADRIQRDQASQEDYDLALLAMEASGKLVHLVNKQNEEIQRKQMEVCKVAAAMTKILSALKR